MSHVGGGPAQTGKPLTWLWPHTWLLRANMAVAITCMPERRRRCQSAHDHLVYVSSDSVLPDASRTTPTSAGKLIDRVCKPWIDLSVWVWNCHPHCRHRAAAVRRRPPLDMMRSRWFRFCSSGDQGAWLRCPGWYCQRTTQQFTLAKEREKVRCRTAVSPVLRRATPPISSHPRLML